MPRSVGSEFISVPFLRNLKYFFNPPLSQISIMSLGVNAPDKAVNKLIEFLGLSSLFFSLYNALRFLASSSLSASSSSIACSTSNKASCFNSVVSLISSDVSSDSLCSASVVLTLGVSVGEVVDGISGVTAASTTPATGATASPTLVAVVSATFAWVGVPV